MSKLATYEGFVENGHVILPPTAEIPEKTRVYVLVPVGDAERTPRIASPRLVHAEQGKDFQMEVLEGASDADL